MRTLLVVSILISTVFSCAKKVAPVATVDKPVTETKTVTEVKPVIAAPVESKMSLDGHITYDKKCGGCHGLKNPGDYTAAQWVPLLNDMAINARLDSTEKANVPAYVTFYSKPTK